ncbi:hypothetical protein [Prauserella endophytica]|uniref:DUF1795 domain-containing protein n=1 Tax=Prauserella endophytica TaxID=1592324 RepID=A0ABY2S764_9PSEU|nr:hypothetical protein [Prauserella endophytica]TKG71752.1 hypothetical protein FCN18_09620 [Prauserella endophytica]
MTTTMPFPIEFVIPDGWRAPSAREAETPDGVVAAVHPEQAATITAAGELMAGETGLPEIADHAIAMLRRSGARVEVLSRTEVGTPDSPGLAQILLVGPETVQCQAFLAMVDVEDSRKRAVLRIVLTTSRDHVEALVGDFQRFLGTVRLATGEAAQPAPRPEERPVPRHTRAVAPGENT